LVVGAWLQGVSAEARAEYAIARRCQITTEQSPDGRIVVDDENGGALGHLV
jgi:hypothetical protein